MKEKLKRFFIGFAGFVFLGGVLLALMIFYITFDLPKIDTLADYKPPIPSQILSKDGTILAELGIEQRELVSLEEIPSIIIDAFLSAEDSSFYEHGGVDYAGILRATLVNLKSGRVVQGGSTITQQVAKSLLLNNTRSYIRKIKDIILAQRIEKKFSKQEILYLYLNQVYLGGGFYGIKAAYRGYYGKELSEGTIAEAAIMAGLLVAPGRYSPYLNPQHARSRQLYVLERLLKNQKITQEQYDDAVKENIRFRLKQRDSFKAPYFTDWVRQRVIEQVGEESFLRDGFRITTTLDFELQQIAESLVDDGLREVDKRQGYKGPLRKINISSDLQSEEVDFRKKFFKQHSNYFVLNDQSERVYELEYSEEKYDDLKKYHLEMSQKVQDARFVPGILPNDPLYNELKQSEYHEAVVVKTDRLARLIYVSIGGLTGIIPYEYFSWAHERLISEEREYVGLVTNPNTIVVPGDVVSVKISKKSVGIMGHLNSSAKTEYAKQPFYNELQKQKYLLCSLEQDPEIQGSLFSLNPHTGEVLAFVGGNNFSKSQFNRVVQALRQPGSAFKPILYAAALENGLTPASILIDSPEALGGVDEMLNWKPRNYDGKFLGPITLRESLEKSRNVPTIKIADRLGVQKVLSFVDRILFDAQLAADLSLSLGTFGVTLQELVSTYSMFPNGGKVLDYKSIVSIVDRDGNSYVLNENVKKKKIIDRQQLVAKDFSDIPMPTATVTETASDNVESNVSEGDKSAKLNPFHVLLGGEQVYDPRLAYIMTNLLRGVVLNGTGMAAKAVSHFLGGKTGTTNNYVDAWFIGFSSNVAAGVWTGFDDNKTIGWGETGAKAALPIWKEYMRAAIKKYGEYDFAVPADVVFMRIDKKTGKLSDSSNPNAFMEAFVSGMTPRTDSTEETDWKESEGNSDNRMLFEDDYFNQQ